MLMQTAVLLASWLLARGTELAVVRPFSTKEEVHRLHESFDAWDVLLPCSADQRATIDLFLVYSRIFDTTSEVADEVARVVDGFEQHEKKWHHCFRAVHVLSAALSEEEDVYDSRVQEENPNWVNGPNEVFRFLLRYFLDSHYQAFFLMELDAQPKKALWLQQLEREVLDYPAVAIRGSEYRGDNWNAYRGTLPKAMRMHINGNAIYFPGHPLLHWLSDRLHLEASTAFNSIPYDLRIAQLMLDAESEKIPEFTETWANFVPRGQMYASDSRLIGNYANTLLNTSFDGGEFIAHDSPANVFKEADRRKLTLAVSHDEGQDPSEFDSMVSTEVHPFQKVLVLLRSRDGVSRKTEVRTPRGYAEVQRRRALRPRVEALCEAASLVETEFFVFMPARRVLRSPISILMNGSQPLLPYLEVSSPLCGKSRCRESVLRAERLFATPLSVHYDLRDTLFVTRLTRQFCSVWLGLQPSVAPSADDFMAWQKSSGNLHCSYSQVDRGAKGWRSWTAHNPLLAMRRLTGDPDTLNDTNETDDANDTEESNSTNGTDSNTTCLYTAQGPCDADPGCTWDSRFQSCSIFLADDNANIPLNDSNVSEMETTTPMPTTLPEVNLANPGSVGRVVMTMSPLWVRRMLNGQCNNCYGKVLTAVARYLLQLSGGRADKVKSRVRLQVHKRLCQFRLQNPLSMTSQEAQLLFRWFLPLNCGAKIWMADRCSVLSSGYTFRRSINTLPLRRRLRYRDPDRGPEEDSDLGRGPRLLQGSAEAVNFSMDMDVEDPTELEEQVPMDDPSFLNGVGAELTSLAAANSLTGVDIPGLTPTEVASPELTAEVVIEVLAEENAGLDIPALQADALNPSALLAATLEETGIADFLSNPQVDLCAGRDCSGRGECNDGICQCDAGWSEPNCQLRIFEPLATTLAATAPPPSEPEDRDDRAVIAIVVISCVTLLLLLLLLLYLVKCAAPQLPFAPPPPVESRTFI